MSIKIAIIVDNPHRDLRGLALLAYQFAKQGATAFLVPMYQQGNDIPLLSPDLVIVNYARENNRELLENYQLLGINVAILDTEGGVLSESGFDSPNNWAKNFHDTGLVDLVDYYSFWGQAVYSAFKKNSGMDENCMSITGCPRYDVCHKPWSALLKYPRKDFILINTNFSAINPTFTLSDKDEQRIFLEQGWDIKYIEQLFENLHRVFPKYLETIEAIAHSDPERTVLIRPHPFENSAVYHSHFANIKNVIINGEGDIFNAIHGASCIVHLNCGSSIDAIRMGKIPISIEFLNTDILRSHAPLPSKISCHAKNSKDLLSLIKDPALQSERYDLKQAMEQVEPWYHSNDGKANERVVEFLLSKSLNKKTKIRNNLSVALRSGRTHPRLRQYFSGCVSLIIGSYATSSALNQLQSSRQGKSIDPIFINTLVSCISQIDNGPTIKVSRLHSPIAKQPLASFKINTA